MEDNNSIRVLDRVRAMLSYGQSVVEIRKALLADGLTEAEAFFAVAAARVASH